jgi:hypothetical protein
MGRPRPTPASYAQRLSRQQRHGLTSCRTVSDRGHASGWIDGCEAHPAAFAPAGSNRSSRTRSEAAEAFGVEGPERDLASMQAVT